MKTEGSQRGRPPLTHGEAKRASFNTRLRSILKEQLETAARESGRSLSEEIELRLENSFRGELLEEIFGPALAAILEMVGRGMRDTGQVAGSRATGTVSGGFEWVENPYAFDQAFQAAVVILEALRPSGDPEIGMPPAYAGLRPEHREVFQNQGRTLGAAYAAGIIDAVCGRAGPFPSFDAEIRRWAERPRRRLPPAVIERLRAAAAKPGPRAMNTRGEEQ